MDKGKIIIHNKTKAMATLILLNIVKHVLALIELGEFEFNGLYGQRHLFAEKYAFLNTFVDIYVSQNDSSYTFWIYDSK